MIALIADIHGNFPALRAVLAKIDALGVERIISLGDVAGYYCLLNECADALRARGIVNLMGNHDHYLVADERCTRSSSAEACLAHQRRIVTPENMAWLARSSRLPLRIGPLSLVHAGWNDPVDEYIETVTPAYFAEREGEIFVSGHTHVQGAWPAGDKQYCNPGSVGQPRDGDPRAAFAIWTGAEMQFHRVPYDIDEITARMRAAGFDESYFENLRTGRRIGGKLSTVRIGS